MADDADMPIEQPTPSPFDASGNLIAPPMPQDFDALRGLFAPAPPIQQQPDIPLPPMDTTPPPPPPGMFNLPVDATSAAAQQPHPPGMFGLPIPTEPAAPEGPTDVKSYLEAQGGEVRPEGTPAQEQTATAERTFAQAETPEQREAAYAALNPDQQKAALDKEAQNYEAMTPEQRAKVDATREGARLELLNKHLLDQATKDREQAQKNYEIYKKASDDVKKRRAALQTQIETLGNKRPEGIGVGQAIAGVIASIVGGFASPFTGGRNLGLEGFNKAIDFHAQQQRDEYERQRQALGGKLNLLSADEEQNGSDLRTNEAQRALASEQLVRGLQAEAQNFSPLGTSASRIGQAILGVKAQQAAALDALDQRNLKNKLDIYKVETERAREAETSRHNQVEEGFKAAKLGGTGGGSLTGTLKAGGTVANPTNPAYAVVVGVNDPFTHEPLLSRFSLDKEGTNKRMEQAETTSNEYFRLRKIYGEMKQLVDDGKGWDEVLTGGRTRTTRGERYDNLRSTAVSVLAKLNDGKTNIGILELNEHIIPERKTSLSLSDASSLIDGAMRDTDTSVEAAFGSAGIDASGMIHHGQQANAPTPTVDAEERERVARENATQHPNDPDAQAELHNADFHASLAKATAENAQTLVNNFAKATPMTRLSPRKEAGTGDEFSAVTGANKSIESYNEMLGKFHEELADKSYLAGVDKKKAGDVQAAGRKRTDQLRKLAADVANSHSAAVDALQRAVDARKQTDAYLRGGRPAEAPHGPTSAAPDLPPALTLQPNQSVLQPPPVHRKGKH